MNTKRIIAAYNLTIEADHEQYWQGHGVACSDYDECATGSGSTTHEAFEDCLDSLAQNDIEFTDEQEKDLREQLGDDLDIVQEHCEVKGDHRKPCEYCTDSMMDGQPEEIQNAVCDYCDAYEMMPDENPDCSVCSGEWHYYVSIDVQYATCQCDNELHRDHESGACENDPTEQVLTDGGRVPMCKGCADFDVDGGRATETNVCPTCDGEGIITPETGLIAKDDVDQVTCSDCEGTGRKDGEL